MTSRYAVRDARRAADTGPQLHDGRGRAGPRQCRHPRLRILAAARRPRRCVGQTLVLDDVPKTIVGVMPRDLRLEVLNNPGAIFRPVTSEHFAALTRAFRAFRVIGAFRTVSRRRRPTAWWQPSATGWLATTRTRIAAAVFGAAVARGYRRQAPREPADGCRPGRRRPADCGRQSGEPAARAIGGARARNGGTRRARCGRMAAGARAPRGRAVVVGTSRPSAALSPRPSSQRSRISPASGCRGLPSSRSIGRSSPRSASPRFAPRVSSRSCRSCSTGRDDTRDVARRPCHTPGVRRPAFARCSWLGRPLWRSSCSPRPCCSR